MFYEDFFDEDLKELVYKYNDTLNDNELKLEVKSKKKWKILFPYKIFDILFPFLINMTLKIGFELNENIPFFLKPSNTYLSILEGAVLFGINPNIIET